MSDDGSLQLLHDSNTTLEDSFEHNIAISEILSALQPAAQDSLNELIFDKVLFWPKKDEKISVLKKKSKIRLPAVASSDKWIEQKQKLLDAKMREEEEKAKGILERKIKKEKVENDKKERAQKLEEKKLKKLAQQQEKQRIAEEKSCFERDCVMKKVRKTSNK